MAFLIRHSKRLVSTRAAPVSPLLRAPLTEEDMFRLVRIQERSRYLVQTHAELCSEIGLTVVTSGIMFIFVGGVIGPIFLGGMPIVSFLSTALVPLIGGAIIQDNGRQLKTPPLLPLSELNPSENKLRVPSFADVFFYCGPFLSDASKSIDDHAHIAIRAVNSGKIDE